jgi:hypothetical protein
MTKLEMVWGDSAEWDIDITNPRTGLPVPLSGCTVKFMAKLDHDDPDADAIIDATATIIPPDTNGKAHVATGTGHTSKIGNELSRLVFDVQVSKSGEGPWTVDRGILTIRPAVVLS